MDLSSHNANPLGVFDGEAVPLSDVVDTRIEESVAAIREFVAEPARSRPPRVGQRPQCGRLRRQFGADSAGSERRSSAPR